MERGFAYERHPGSDHEREIAAGEGEQSPEREKSPEELLLEAFENGSRFDDEDEKARDYNARLDQADEYQKQLDDISEQVSQATSQLATVPLTPEQLAILGRIEALMAERARTKDPSRQQQLDREIKVETSAFTDLPTTPEQSSLLDDILELFDQRDVLEDSLQAVFREASNR
jgi:hypothetical protein